LFLYNRASIYAASLAQIEKFNSDQDKDFKIGENHFSGWTRSEFLKSSLGYVRMNVLNRPIANSAPVQSNERQKRQTNPPPASYSTCFL
jgi:hypothetical protein